MIRGNIKSNINFPNVDILAKELKVIADKVFIPLLTDNIEANRDINGRRHPRLEESTIRAKVKTKRTHFPASHPLINEGKLRRAFKSYRKSTNKVIIKVTPDREYVASILQLVGVGKTNKIFEFFGITQGMERSAILHADKVLRGIVKNA